VLLLEQLAEPLPRQARGVPVEPVVQLVLQVRPRLLGLQRVARLGRLALVFAGDRVVPLKGKIGSVAPVLDPDDDATLWHGLYLSCRMNPSVPRGRIGVLLPPPAASISFTPPGAPPGSTPTTAPACRPARPAARRGKLLLPEDQV